MEKSHRLYALAARFLADYGMLLVLAGLCVFLSVRTIAEQHPTGAAAARQLADVIVAQTPANAQIVILARDGADDQEFTATLQDRVVASGRSVAARVNGQPFDAAQALQRLRDGKVKIDAFAVTEEVDNWDIFRGFEQTPRLRPTSYYWSTFLTPANLLNIANQIAVIAIMAIGVTMVIIAGGIDLSVGSLLALSAVVAAYLIRAVGGAYEASALSMTLCCVGAILVCGLVGLGTGFLVTAFRVPAFIVTLGVMLIARGAAGKLSQGQSIFQLPEAFTWLGRESAFGFIPNAVVLMLLLYAVAHFVMAHTVLGRYIYAAGGNREAARLSGVPVERVVMCVFVVSGALAGLGGVILASQFKSGSPTYGVMYELYVIAAVVVGGTSLSGGEGKILGTLIGAFVIAVIQNGMNLLGLGSYDQQIVLGVVLVLAVLFDRVKHLGWLRLKRG
ncbi:MAG: ABC transporter permease [Planctomycetes bacterium]|nr:ABC transporter permease [Planctomycetota bacterium]